MKSVYVELPDTRAVQQFVEALSPLDGEFELVSGQYILDARSLMGIFSLDRSGPIELRIFNDTEENRKAVAPFLAQQAARKEAGDE